MIELQIPPLAINFAMKRNQCSDEDISIFQNNEYRHCRRREFKHK